ncbi:MAG TPA: TIGR01906 family membrane protein, partial [Anaerolineales bacterium]
MPRDTVVSWSVALLVLLALIGLALRVLLTPAFLAIAYRMPYFPADEYGFTAEDRLHWAPYALNYLVNNADVSYLADLKFENGNPLFNDRELKHMQDVKDVTRGALRVWYATVLSLALVGLWARRSKREAAYLRGLKQGGWLMIGLAGAVGVIVLVGLVADPDLFWNFFVAFHGLFFEGESWLFLYSDTLIRLFPIRFWEEAFLFAAAVS